MASERAICSRARSDLLGCSVHVACAQQVLGDGFAEGGNAARRKRNVAAGGYGAGRASTTGAAG